MDPTHQKLSAFIPPKIDFKGDITKMKILYKIPFELSLLDRINFFKGYILINFGNGISFLEKDTYNIIYKKQLEVKK